ncbi:ATP-grasp fold amidoligase family protein [Pseudomonas matsuisoli]|uniref:Glycosyl transferase n=1 Tax=Pseudomonas matsuisoli TaxID=1515666 RepID=A0A917PXR1_9PSED|nr:ATP-grasp fold amidoligase family protein [Pseudomonas matsuisoli]GGJ96948.1 glycosyl transferase [Pseudomonas matsuisoli]
MSLKKGLKQGALQCFKRLPWVYQDSLYYFKKFRRLPNLRSPKDFNEKLLYRKFIYGDYQCYGRRSDKFLVREHVAGIIGDQYLIPLIHETSDPETLLTLPSWNGTVIKPNHGSSMVELLLQEPDDQQKRQIVQRCKDWLKTDFATVGREAHYRYISPRIVVEKCIGDGKSAPIDYKFHMFNKQDGTFDYVLQIIYNRFGSALSMNFYVNNLQEAFHRIRDTGLDIAPKLDALSQALSLSKQLASDFDYVRVDWYIEEDRVWFGELTFTPGAGLVTGLEKGLSRMMGDMWIQNRPESADKLRPVVHIPTTLESA